MKSAWVMKASPDPSKLSCARRMGAIMDREDIIKLVREVGYPLVEYEGTPYIPPLLEVLLKTVAAERRIWVGLTDEEVMEIAFNFDVPSLVVRTVEAKLRSKNENRN
jgi:hypothetical protein